MPWNILATPRPNSLIALPACENAFTNASITRPMVLKPFTMLLNAHLAIDQMFLKLAIIICKPARTTSDLLYNLTNQLVTSIMPLTTSTSAFLANISAFCFVSSHPLLLMSNKAAVTWSSSCSVLIFSSNNSPYSPVFAFTSSNDVDMVARLSIISCEANLPCRPNTAVITWPTSWALSGNSLIAALTCLTASKVVIEPSRNFACIASTSIPTPCNASLVDLDISRMRAEPMRIASRPCSVKIPLRVCVMIATISSAAIPASWKVGASCFTFAKKSPFTSAPAAKPLLMTSIACFPSRWKFAINVSTACKVSLKSLPMTSAVAWMLERK